MIVKVFKDMLDNFDVYNKEQIFSLFKDIFIKVKNKYNLSGLFDINVYVNEDYGMIIEILNLCYYKGEIDVKIRFHLDSVFLTEINVDEILDYDEVYYYMNKFYGNYKNYSDSEIIYKDIDIILNDGIKVC